MNLHHPQPGASSSEEPLASALYGELIRGSSELGERSAFKLHLTSTSSGIEPQVTTMSRSLSIEDKFRDVALHPDSGELPDIKEDAGSAALLVAGSAAHRDAGYAAPPVAGSAAWLSHYTHTPPPLPTPPLLHISRQLSNARRTTGQSGTEGLSELGVIYGSGDRGETNSFFSYTNH